MIINNLRKKLKHRKSVSDNFLTQVFALKQAEMKKCLKHLEEMRYTKIF